MADAANFVIDPEWLAHRYADGSDAFSFVHVDRIEHGMVPFLTDEYIGNHEIGGEVSADLCLDVTDSGMLHYLFHSAFCGSTMLIRALEQKGVAMGLSEPMVLNDVVGARRRGAEPQVLARIADGATRLLGRPFGPGEAVVVKPSNVINPLAQLLLGLRPQAKAVFLHAPLETFLVSVAKKGMHCRIWARELLAGYLSEGVLDTMGFAPNDFFVQSDLQVAAVGWLAQHHLFEQLATRVGSRLASLDADLMLADPAIALGAVAAHYGFKLDVTEALAGPAFNRHSKSGEGYSTELRQSDYDRVRAAHDEEIAMVASWAHLVADNAGINFAAPNPLLTS